MDPIIGYDTGFLAVGDNKKERQATYAAYVTDYTRW